MDEPVTDAAGFCQMTESWLLHRDQHAQPRAGATSTHGPSGEDPHPPIDEDSYTYDPPVAEPPYGSYDEEDEYAYAPAADPGDGDDDADYSRTPVTLDPYDDSTDDAELDAHQSDLPGESLSAAQELPDAVGGGTLPTPTDADEGSTPASPETPPRFSKRIAVAFVGITATAAVIAVGALLAISGGTPHHPAQDILGPAPAHRGVTSSAPPTSTAAPEATDPPVPFTATAVGCLPGSTAAQSVAGPTPNQAWVCVTGGNIGQFVRLTLGRTVVITAVCVAPGWVGTDTSGADQWHQHRVLTRVQWSFNDSPPTVVPQDTGSVHGDACIPMPNHGVLASTVLMLVQETGRAPADTAPTTSDPSVGGGPLGQIVGTPAEPAPTSDPALPPDQSHTDIADTTFASSSIKLFGHSPQ